METIAKFLTFVRFQITFIAAELKPELAFLT